MAQAMLKRSAADSSGVDNLKENQVVMMETTEVSKCYSNFTLFHTVYNINFSGTKKIMVGLTYERTTCQFVPIIKILFTHSSNGLVLESNAWTGLQSYFDEILKYLDKDITDAEKPTKLEIGNLSLNFSKAHGQRCIILEEKTDVIMSKKKRSYVPAVVLQKNSFIGLAKSVVCVDERYRRIERIAHAVNQCMTYTLDELKTIIGKENLYSADDAELFIADVLLDVKYDIMQRVRGKFEKNGDQVFVVHYFEIIFTEMVCYCTGLFFEKLCESYAKNVFENVSLTA